MPVAEDSPAALVARFLRSNHYDETLNAFLLEANLPLETGLSTDVTLTIEKVLEEKRVFDLSLSFEKTSVEDLDQSWSEPAPTKPHTISTLPTSANILHVSVPLLLTPSPSNTRAKPRLIPYVIVTTAARTLHVLSAQYPYEVSTVYPLLPETHDAPILSTAVLRQRWLFTTGMSGRLTVYDMLDGGKEVVSRTDHTKYAVKVAFWETAPALVSGDDRERAGHVWIATAGWDAKVFLYYICLPPVDVDEPTRKLPFPDRPTSCLTLASNPESILFIAHPDAPVGSEPLLLLSRRDSTLLHYYSLPSTHLRPINSPQAISTHDSGNRKVETTLLGTQNLTPHSLAWTAFTPSFLSPHPSDPTLVAVATSSTPHMRLLIVRLLLPPLSPNSSTTASPAPLDEKQADAARRQIAIADRESAAIQLQINTMAPQTAYSTPFVAWRPDGRGVWVNGDDGVVRGVEVTGGGKVREVLKGHQAGVKVRCLWGGFVVGGDGDGDGDGEREEWVVSGGFDRRVVVWRCGGGGSGDEDSKDGHGAQRG